VGFLAKSEVEGRGGRGGKDENESLEGTLGLCWCCTARRGMLQEVRRLSKDRANEREKRTHFVAVSEKASQLSNDLD
jgi:hypothetical protein